MWSLRTLSGFPGPRTWRYAREFAISAVGCFAAGKLVLLFPIAAAHQPAVWVAAGIALACVLLFGYRAAFGVFAGSLLLAISTAEPGLTPQRWMIASSFALGASIQAVAGALLIRRKLSYPTGFVGSRVVASFLLLGGPISCAIGPTWALISLVFVSAIDPRDYSYFWWTSWFSSSVGVIIFTPIVLAWSGRLAVFSNRRKALITVPVLCAMILVGFTALYTHKWERDRIALILERRTDHLAYEIRDRLDNYIDVLRAVQAFYDSSAQVNRRDFHVFVSRWFARHPGLRTLSWNPRISAGERAAYERAAQKDGLIGFRITELDSQGRFVTAGQRDEYVPAYFLETRQGTNRALGFDVASNAPRRQALEEARDGGKIIATEQVNLTASTDNPPGFLVFAPVFGAGPLRNTDERRRQLRGYIAATVRVRDILESVQKSDEVKGIEIAFYQAGGASTRSALAAKGSLHQTAKVTGKQDPIESLTRTIPFELAGRRWVMEFMPTQEYLRSEMQGQAWIVLSAGLLFTGLLSAFLLTVTGHIVRLQEVNGELQQEVAKRRGAEQELNKFAVIVDSSGDAIIGVSSAGKITTWNHGAERIYGYTEQEAEGQGVGLLYPPENIGEQAMVHEKLLCGESITQYETVRLRKDGRRIHVSLTLSPMRDAAGTITGITSITRDISAQRQAEAELKRDREEVARRLHDSVAQSLAALSMQLELAQRHVPKDLVRARDHLDKIKEIVWAEHNALRAFLNELRGAFRLKDAAGEQIDLAALEALRRRLEIQWGLTIRLHLASSLPFVPEKLYENVSCIIQEAAANAVRHGHASLMRIEIAQREGTLELSISDNGRGFPNSFEYDEAPGIGPVMLRSRVASLGGSLHVRSAASGARLDISLPFLI